MCPVPSSLFPVGLATIHQAGATFSLGSSTGPPHSPIDQEAGSAFTCSSPLQELRLCEKGGPCGGHEPELLALGKRKWGHRRGEVLAQGHRAQVLLCSTRGLPGCPELLTGQPEWKQCLEQAMLGHRDKGPEALPDLGSGAAAGSGKSVVGEGTG